MTSLSLEALAVLYLPNLIKAVRRTLGPQKTLAAAVGVTTRTVMRWEKGENTPSPEHLVKIATVGGLPLEVFQDAVESAGPLDDFIKFRAELRAEWDAFREEIRHEIRDDFADLLTRILRFSQRS